MATDAYDVIVVGTGVSGLAAALAAHENGLRPLVLEKDDKVGGGTTESAGLIWIGDNHLARAEGYEDNKEESCATRAFSPAARNARKTSRRSTATPMRRCNSSNAAG